MDLSSDQTLPTLAADAIKLGLRLIRFERLVEVCTLYPATLKPVVAKSGKRTKLYVHLDCKTQDLNEILGHMRISFPHCYMTSSKIGANTCKARFATHR